MDQTVSIVQRVLPHYRTSFFDKLHARLAERSIALRLFYGKEKQGTLPSTVLFDRDWSSTIENRYLSVFGRELIWQKLERQLVESDLVVMEQANRLLLNYRLLLNRRFARKFRLAYWGHGMNFQQSQAHRNSERLKRYTLREVDWWFAYTGLSAAVIEECGFAKDRITVVNNSIDAEEFSAEVRRLRAKLSPFSLETAPSALFCGSMYADKRVEFLLQALPIIKRMLPEFEMVFIGAGPTSNQVMSFCEKHSWSRYEGIKTGLDRAPYFAKSQALLLPGAVGLAVIDSFAAETPLITVQGETHGPEIDYLVHGVNGLVLRDDVVAYAEAVARILSVEAEREVLTAGCRQYASELTIDHMVDRFAHGVSRCLERP